MLTAWAKHLRRDNPTFLFHSASSFLPKTPLNDPKAKGKAKESADDAVGTGTLLEYLSQCAGRVLSETLQVAVVGLTNVSRTQQHSRFFFMLVEHTQLTVWQICHREFTRPKSRCFGILPNLVYGCMENNDHPGVRGTGGSSWTQDQPHRYARRLV